jgi:hypothetical protein
MTTVTAYVVTATHVGAEKDEHGVRHRTDLAKFFTREDADTHADRLHPSWVQVKVEERSESEADQHPAHAKGKLAERRG